MKKQVVTIGTMHICPMVTGMIPHIGGPIIGPGCPGVKINGKPVSLIGDICTCSGPPDVVAQGHSGVFVNGTPIVVHNCLTAHGGIIPMGESGVIISSSTPVSTLTMNIKRILFPKLRVIDKVLASASGQSQSLTEAIVNQEKIKEEAINDNVDIPDIDLSM